MRPLWLVGFALVYLYSFPYFERIYHANELPRIYLVRAIVDHGELHIDRAIKAHGFAIDTSIYGGHYYANKAPGMSLLGVPVYAAAKGIAHLFGQGPPSLRTLTYLLRLFCVGLPSILFLPLFVRLIKRFALDEGGQAFALVGYALGTMALTLSLNYLSHGPAAIALALAFLAFTRALAAEASAHSHYELSPGRLALGGFALGSSVLLEYQSAFLAAPIACIGLWAALSHPGRRLARISTLAAGGLVPTVILLAYHKACFGSYWATGYKYPAFAPFRALHRQGFLGLREPTWNHFQLGVFSPSTGLFCMSPFLLLGVVGLVVALRSAATRASAICAGAVLILGILFYSSIVFAPGGWEIGPRYIAGVVPFLAAPAALGWSCIARSGSAAQSVAARWFGRAGCWLASGLLAASIIIHVGGSLIFPHWPDRLVNPVVELGWPLLANGYAPYNLGRALFPGKISLWPAFGVALLLLALALGRAWQKADLGRQAAIAVGATALGILFCGAFWLAPRSPVGEAAHVWKFVTRIWEPPLPAAGPGPTEGAKPGAAPDSAAGPPRP